MITQNIVGVKELRTNLDHYINKVKKGASFTIVRRSRAVFKIVPILEEEEQWEPVIDFTKIKKGGVELSKILSRL